MIRKHNEDPIMSLEINFDDIIIEDNVSKLNLKRLGECKILIYSNEGPLPHFHLQSKNDEFKTCICIYSAHYFAHGEAYRGTLNSGQRNQLDAYLRSRVKNNMTIWEQIANFWETNTT